MDMTNRPENARSMHLLLLLLLLLGDSFTEGLISGQKHHMHKLVTVSFFMCGS